MSSKLASLKSRVWVAVVGIPLLLWVLLWAPKLVMMTLFLALAGIGAAELQMCVSGGQKSELTGLSAIAAIFTVEWYVTRPDYVAIFFVFLAVAFFFLAIIKGGEIKFAQIAAGLFGSIAIGYAFAAFLRIDSMGLHRAYLLLPFILSFACDTFAYFVGCSIGKHKLAPKVSPKKSVEGAIGGLVGNVLCGVLFAFIMQRWVGVEVGYGAVVILALACGIVAEIGDLSFSLIKREYGVKDYGKLFFAHGGVLDRFDSVLFVAPMIELILTFMK